MSTVLEPVAVPVENAAAPAAPPAPPTAPRWLRFAPIVFFELYLNASILIFAFGPWQWALPNPGRLYRFVVIAHLALLVGYVVGIRQRPRGYFAQTSMKTLLRLSVALTLVLYFPTVYRLTGGAFDAVAALRDPGAVYYRYQELMENEVGGSTGFVTLVRVLCSPLLALLPALVARCWRESTVRMRALGVVAMVSNLTLYLFTGRNKGLIDLVLLLPWLFALYAGGGRVRFRPRRVLLGTALFLGALLWFSDYYVRNNEGRTGPGANIFWVRALGGMEADPDHPLLRGRSPETQAIILGLSFNQTHGYYALALSLEKPFESAWGVGHSYFLQQMERRFTGRSDLGSRSYPARLEAENGWSYTEFWHTTYTWFASDVSFPGTWVLMFLLGYLLATSWRDSLRGDNPWAMGMLVTLVTVLYYLPTNNIVFGFAEGLASFWGLLVLWQLTRRPVRVGGRTG
jgi:hypothetical protein